MKSYSTLILDAFDTLLYIDRSRLFPHRFGERTIRTTAPRIHEAYQAAGGSVPFERFVGAFIESWNETNRRRETEHREISSVERFGLMLEMLDDDSPPGALAQTLAETHMEHLAPALSIPESHRQVLVEARSHGLRLAMISNFDYSPTLERCLVDHGVRDLFDAVVVSDEVGWRKPHPTIFERAFERLNVTPEESLFVGDRLELDVDGAAAVGMDVVWIDSGAQAWSPEFAKPHYTIRSLPELSPLLAEMADARARNETTASSADTRKRSDD